MAYRRQTSPPLPPPRARPTQLLALLFRIAVLHCLCQCDAVAKLFESKAKKVARLTAELAALEAERLSKFVVVFGYEFDKLGFYTSVSVSTVLLVALIVQLGRSRRKWKRLALSGAATAQPASPAPTATVPRYTIMLILATAVFFSYLVTFNLGETFESNKKTSKRFPSGKGNADPKRLSNLVIVFGKYELDEKTFYVLVLTSMIFLVALGAQIGVWFRQMKQTQLNKTEDASKETEPVKEKTLDVIIVGCGPKSVGWFHLMQFLDMPNINVRAIVEPFYLDKKRCPYPPQTFVDLVMMMDEMGIRCVYHISQLELFQQQTLCVIAGRTHDNPKFFRECIGMNASHIYLEAPGAPSTEQLEDMNRLAETRGVEVYMGYQRLCSSYIEEAVSLSRSIPKSHVFFCHNETYHSNEIPLVVGRYPEGMLRSMAAQELAVLVTKLGVKAEEIKSFKVNTNRLFSEKQTFYNKSNGKELADFARVAFKITIKNGRSVSVMADRSGGLVSFAVVKSYTGQEIKRFESHSEEEASLVHDELSEDKEIMQQFTIESEEYLELKNRVVKSILNGYGNKYSGLVSIQNAIDVMILADYCTAEINAKLDGES